MSNDDLMKEGLRIANEEGEKEKAHAKKLAEERSSKAADAAARNAADSARTKAAQTAFDFGGPAEKYTKEEFQKMEKQRFAEEARQNEQRDKEIEKARARAAENQEFKDKRVKPSPIVVESELAKMKEITAPKSKGGSGGGGGGGIPSDKMDKMKKMNYKAGGKVSSASKRGDGIAQRGKTRGKIV